MKEDFKIKILANTADLTLQILTRALLLCRGTTRRKETCNNNSLVKIPSRNFQFIHFLSPFFLVRANLPVVKPGDKQEPKSYHLVKRHLLAVRELDAGKKKIHYFLCGSMWQSWLLSVTILVLHNFNCNYLQRTLRCFMRKSIQHHRVQIIWNYVKCVLP